MKYSKKNLAWLLSELENALHEIGTQAEHGNLEFYAVTSIVTNALPE